MNDMLTEDPIEFLFLLSMCERRICALHACVSCFFDDSAIYTRADGNCLIAVLHEKIIRKKRQDIKSGQRPGKF